MNFISFASLKNFKKHEFHFLQDEDEGFEAYFPGPRFAGPVDTEFLGGRDNGDLAEEGKHDKREGLNHAYSEPEKI